MVYYLLLVKVQVQVGDIIVVVQFEFFVVDIQEQVENCLFLCFYYKLCFFCFEVLSWVYQFYCFEDFLFLLKVDFVVYYVKVMSLKNCC